jgi:hypothetical protein
MTQPPRNRDATEHRPPISKSLEEGADRNLADAVRSRRQTEELRETSERLSQKLQQQQPKEDDAA